MFLVSYEFIWHQLPEIRICVTYELVNHTVARCDLKGTKYLPFVFRVANVKLVCVWKIVDFNIIWKGLKEKNGDLKLICGRMGVVEKERRFHHIELLCWFRSGHPQFTLKLSVFLNEVLRKLCILPSKISKRMKKMDNIIITFPSSATFRLKQTYLINVANWIYSSV